MTDIGELNAQIREGLHGDAVVDWGGRPIALTGPGTSAIVELEREVFDRHRRLSGWAAAAELHAKIDRESNFGIVPTCGSCTALVQLAIGDGAESPTFVDWPCDTAKALGLDR